MEVLLVESSVIINAMLPSLLFEGEVIVEDVLSIDHFSFFPFCFVEASLDERRSTFG